ncbi:MAG: hypothetical protein B6242_15820 [Anaerolineaceae bacterium 4572_78]|nr:MAG: hypothetical protein B6242_15820 [Anaerolineaceae bacterium 4572_78]
MTNSKLIEQIQRYILILILLFLATGCVSLDNPTDIFQGRENGKTPSPSPDCIIGQTFISRKANLNVIEVLLTQPDIIRVSPQDDTQEDIQPIITLHLRSTSNLDDDLRTVSIDTSYVFHPIVRFSFPPIPDSQEQSYYFFLSGTSSDALLLKYADIDMYHDGVYMLNHREEPGDLWFRTYYDYDLACVMRDIATYLTVKIGFSLKIMLIAIALLFLPGAGLLILMKYPFPGAARKPYLQMRSTDILFTHGHRENSHDILIWLGLSFGLSLALAPLLILWTTTLGLRLGKVGIIIYLIVSGVIVVYGIVKHYPKRNMTKYDWAWGGVCAFIILLGIILRFVQIHDLVLPAWVDPVHHTMIARLIADSGHVPDTFRPFIPNDYFYYHYGFHTIAAYFQWLSDLEMSQVLLILGQILNVGAILVSYLLAKGLTGRRMIGVWSMIITGFIASMPAYYVTWGRYTQLTGLIILPATIVLTMWWLESDNSKFDWRRLILVVISWAGLFLTHYRVLFFAIAFLVVYVVYVVLMYRSNFTWLKWFIIRGASMVGLSMLFALPWLIRVVNQAIIRIGSSFPTSIQSAAETNTVPLQYIFSGQEYILVALAIGGAVWGILRGEHGIILSAKYLACK